MLQKQKIYEKVKFIKFDVENFTDKKLSSITKNNEFIINCIGLIKPYIDENKDYYKATLINIIFPSRLSKFCKKKNKIFQIATDCVYSGDKKIMMKMICMMQKIFMVKRKFRRNK